MFFPPFSSLGSADQSIVFPCLLAETKNERAESICLPVLSGKARKRAGEEEPKMRLCLRLKLPLVLVLFITVGLALFDLAFLARERLLIAQKIQDDYVKSIFALRDASRDALQVGDYASLRAVADSVKKGRDIEYALAQNSSGQIVAHSDRRDMGEVPKREINFTAQESPIVFLQSFQDVDGRSMLDIAAPVMVGRERIGTVEIGFTREALERQVKLSLGPIISDVAAFSFMILVLISIVVLFLSDLIFKTLEILNQRGNKPRFLGLGLEAH